MRICKKSSAADFSRLSAYWYRWAPRMGSGEIVVSTDCDDCEILFKTEDHSLHLRHDKHWWIVDTVDDRGARRNSDAKLSNFDLTEKYLIWLWSTATDSSLASGPLGADLYKQGYAPGIAVTPSGKGRYNVRFHRDCAELIIGDSMIFSHIMKKSLDEILHLIHTGGR